MLGSIVVKNLADSREIFEQRADAFVREDDENRDSEQDVEDKKVVKSQKAWIKSIQRAIRQIRRLSSKAVSQTSQKDTKIIGKAMVISGIDLGVKRLESSNAKKLEINLKKILPEEARANIVGEPSTGFATYKSLSLRKRVFGSIMLHRINQG